MQIAKDMCFSVFDAPSSDFKSRIMQIFTYQIPTYIIKGLLIDKYYVMIDLNLKGRTLLSKVSSMYLLKINLVLRAGRVCGEAGVSPLTAGAGTRAQSPQFHTQPILAQWPFMMPGLEIRSMQHVALTLLSLCHRYVFCWKTLTRDTCFLTKIVYSSQIDEDLKLKVSINQAFPRYSSYKRCSRSTWDFFVDQLTMVKSKKQSQRVGD